MDYKQKWQAAMAENQRLTQENTALRGVTPALPPRFESPDDMPRYGIRWHDNTTPLTVPMDDGYWTPYHLLTAHDQAVAVRTIERFAVFLTEHHFLDKTTHDGALDFIAHLKQSTPTKK
jgi:hypothetical protein